MFTLRRSALPIVRRTAMRRTATRRMASDMPVPQSQYAKFADGKPRNEGWESTIAWFYPSSFLIIVWIVAFDPETDIRAWANAEARARLELKRQGMTEFKFGTHYQSLSDDELKKEWDEFSAKALRMVRIIFLSKYLIPPLKMDMRSKLAKAHHPSWFSLTCTHASRPMMTTTTTMRTKVGYLNDFVA